MTNASPTRKPTNAARKAELLKKLSDWIDEGCEPTDAVERLSTEDYDFLVEQDVDLDALILSPEQLKNLHVTRKIERTVKAGGYNKKYPQAKQDLFNGIADHIREIGGEIIPKDKENYRDLDFTLHGTHYKIVLSNPRT